MKIRSLFMCFITGLIFVNTIYAESVETPISKIKLSGLLQFWYQNEDNAKPSDTFRLRRAEIKISGEIKPGISFGIMFDPAQVREDDVIKSDLTVTSVGRKSVLQDFVVTIKPFDYLSVDFGQYKVPFGMEGLESSAKLDFVERAAGSSKFKWGDYRDAGVICKGDFKIRSILIQPLLGVFNGEGQNKLDANNPKDMIGRLVIKPLESLHLGVAFYDGKTGINETENVHTGGELKFFKPPFSVYGEYMTGKSGGTNKETYYATFGYKLMEQLQIVGRYDYYDPNTEIKDDSGNETTGGINYFIENHNAKIQLNYVIRTEKSSSLNNDIVRLNVQISY